MKLTQGQNAFVAGLTTFLIASLSASLAGLHPFLSGSSVDWVGLAMFLVYTVLPAVVAAVVAYIRSNPQQSLQAVEDTANQLPQISDGIHQLIADLEQHLQHHAQSPLVVVHNATPSVSQLQPILTEQLVQPVVTPPTPVTPPQPQQVTPMVALPNASHTGTAKPDDTQPFAAIKP